jgi:2-methylcitrate dehydratase PrpD
MKPEVTQTLARFVAATGWEGLPDAVRHEAKRSILNFLAAALAGCREPPIEIALKSLQEFSGREQATLIGRRERIDTLAAAFLNAASGNVFDFDDTHLPTVIHPTAPVAPALLALAERRRTSGRDLLLGLVLGCEIECRIGIALSPGHYRRGWHITATCGVFGAAAGAARLLGLDVRRHVFALGNAAGQSSGLAENLGTAAKSIGVGNAARNGLWSALLAEQDFDGPPRPIEGTQGFLSAMGEPPDWPALTENLGASWEIARNAYKPYPCGIVIHPAIDAALALRRDHAIAPQAIDRVIVRGNPLLAKRTGRPEVTTGREAQVSAQHSLAAAFLFGKVLLAHYTDACATDPAVIDLRRRIVLVDDEQMPVEAARVEVRTRDGAEHAVSIDFARGSVQRPMSDAELEDKLMTLAAGRLSKPRARQLIEAVWSLDRSDDAASLMRLTGPDI